IAEYYQAKGFNCSRMDPALFELQAATLTDLRGGDREENARILRQILAGQELGPKRDAVLLNAAAALFVAGKAKSVTDGWDRAAEVIDRGTALAKLNTLASYRP